MTYIYTDTNVLRYFRIAFAETSLPEDIRDRMVLAPLTVLELASQLGTGGAEEAFAAFKILRPTHHIDAAGMWLLPWPDDFFPAFFSLRPNKNTTTPNLTNLVLNIWGSTKAGDLNEEGREMRNLWDETTNGLARDFSDGVHVLRSKGSWGWAEHKSMLCKSIAERGRIDETKVNCGLLAQNLDAYYILTYHLYGTAIQNKNYNFHKNRNDHIDAEVLIYLADPRLHLLTCDEGFCRVASSSQANRVHIEREACLKDPEYVTEKLRSILRVTETAA